MTIPWQTAWVTGASSGIGRELALQLATKNIKVFASARRTDKLKILSSLNDNIYPISMDVSQITDVRKKTNLFLEDDNFPDLIILNAGVSKLFTIDKIEESYQEIVRSMDVNYFGVVNCLAVLLPSMIKRKSPKNAIEKYYRY